MPESKISNEYIYSRKMMTAPKPAMETETRPANLPVEKIEKRYQNAGPGWNTRRPKAGK